MLRNLLVGAAFSVAAGTADATWSLVVVDTRTGEVGVASATCLTGLDLQALTPVLITGVGAAAAQSAGDTTQRNRTFIRDRLLERVAPSGIVTGLSAFDGGHESRQYGIVDVQGRTATFTGVEAGAWAGGQTGSVFYTYAGKTGHLVYAVQGNVLTGAPVVQAAVDALRNSDGDMPLRIMAAMEAARAMGGDGRCSCPGGVTSCGAPPAAFTKSAHIGYMLIARAGDRDGSTAVYPAGQNASEFGIADLTGDGLPEIVALNPGTGQPAMIFANTSEPGSPFAKFAAATTHPIPFASRVTAIGDVTGDGIRDMTMMTDAVVAVHPGLGGLNFGARLDSPVSSFPTTLQLADLDGVHGPDLISVNLTPALLTMLNDGTGRFGPPTTHPLGNTPVTPMVLDVDGDSDLDVLVVARGISRMQVFRGDGAGAFTESPAVVLPLGSAGGAAADFDSDGDRDVIIAGGGSTRPLTLLRNNGVGSFTSTTLLSMPAAPTDIVGGDFNADGHADVAVLFASLRSFITYLGSGTGVFTPAGASLLSIAPTRIVPADLNGDARTDLVFNSGTNGMGITTARPDGSFPAQAGTAGGDYFMTLNVPNTSAASPDPVITLRNQFDAWRAALVGKTDAVQSDVLVPRLPAYGTAGRSGVLRVVLRDWRGAPVTTAGHALTATRIAGGSGAISAAAPVEVSPGVFEVPLTSGGTSLLPDEFEIVVQEGGRRVVLMPRTIVRQWQCPSDFNGDGDQGTDADIAAFFQCLAGSCCEVCHSADVNGDGDTGTDQDIERFFALLAAGCE